MLSIHQRGTVSLSKEEPTMEYFTKENIITAVLVVLMIYFLIKLLVSKVGDNRPFYTFAFVALGIGLYLWRSGTAVEIINNLFGSLK